MHISDFIRKWKQSTLKERSGSQEHFLDLCDVLGQQKPADADPDGTWYTFEKGAEKHAGGNGFADVWKKGYFAWEYKGKEKDLKKAYNQLLQYRGALENPPLLVVSDMETIEIYTNFTNTPEEVHTLLIDELGQPQNFEKLKWLFTNPERFKPGTTSEQITSVVARKFAELAQVLRDRGNDPHDVAHFLSKIVFCLFAEDVGLLPKQILTNMIEGAAQDAQEFNEMLRELLVTMNRGGRFGSQKIRYFNGGLFNDEIVIPLEAKDIKLLGEASKLDWSAVEPSILGTLFERGLDPSKRSQLGAHYTPRTDIERIINPVMMDPLEQDWRAICDEADQALAKAEASGNKGSVTKAINKSREHVEQFLSRLRVIRVLDPACGSGNFLYIALEKLHDLEKRCMIRLADLEGGQLSPFIEVGPHQVMGIELNPYAAELARVTIWIGHLQWRIQNGFGYAENPVLQNLETIRNMDAIIDLSNPEHSLIPEWPETDYIVGNPPFLGGSSIRSLTGDRYYQELTRTYNKVVPGGADLVCYWFERARVQILNGKAKYIGFVSTNSIRDGKSRRVLENIKDSAEIYTAWSDEPWTVEGAAVRISITCFTSKELGQGLTKILNGSPVVSINSNLTAGTDLTQALAQKANKHVCFEGTKKYGPFEIDGEIARTWLAKSGNPNKRPNKEVLKLWMNGKSVTDRLSDKWIIDFTGLSEEEASYFEKPFEYALDVIKPYRDKLSDVKVRENWWIFERPRLEMRAAIQPLRRYIVTPRVSKHRLFIWGEQTFMPDTRLQVIAKDGDTFFGILHSKFHEIWSLATCSWHGVGNDPTYNAKSCFETYPFPDGLTPDLKPEDYSNPHAEAIAAEARRLNELRENWLNPSDLVQRVPEVVPGYPDRILPKDDEAAKELKKRTLTNLYNQKPAWLVKAHQRLDAAVAAAYGWPADLSDDEVLRSLFELNQARAQAQTSGVDAAKEQVAVMAN